MKLRRQIAVQIFREISPALRKISDCCLRHDGAGFYDVSRDSERGVSLRSAVVDPEKPGMRLRFRRLDSGLTLRNVAASVGLSPAQLSRIERGLSAPNALTLKKLENILEVSEALTRTAPGDAKDANLANPEKLCSWSPEPRH